LRGSLAILLAVSILSWLLLIITCFIRFKETKGKFKKGKIWPIKRRVDITNLGSLGSI